MAKHFTAQLLAKQYQTRFGGTMAHAEEVIYFIQESIQEEVYRGNSYNLPMIGKFHPYTRKAREAHNPKTMEKAFVKAQYTVKFKPSKKMVDWLNKNRVAK